MIRVLLGVGTVVGCFVIIIFIQMILSYLKSRKGPPAFGGDEVWPDDNSKLLAGVLIPYLQTYLFSDQLACRGDVRKVLLKYNPRSAVDINLDHVMRAFIHYRSIMITVIDKLSGVMWDVDTLSGNIDALPNPANLTTYDKVLGVVRLISDSPDINAPRLASMLECMGYEIQDIPEDWNGHDAFSKVITDLLASMGVSKVDAKIVLISLKIEMDRKPENTKSQLCE